MSCARNGDKVNVLWHGNNCADDRPCPPTQRLPLSHFDSAARHAAIAQKAREAQEALDRFHAVEAVRRLHPAIP